MFSNRLICTTGALLTLVVAASAQVFYDNFATANGYDPDNGWTVFGPDTFFEEYFAQGFSFTSALSGQVGKITVGMLHIDLPEGTVNKYIVELHADSDGAPGTILGSWAMNDVPLFAGSSTPATTITVAGGPTLVAGTKYWLAMAPGDDASMGAWGRNVTGASSPIATSSIPGSWDVSEDQPEGAFRVEAVPEPATICVLSLGVVAMIRRRRSKR